MTVTELIKKLKELPKDAEIYIVHGDWEIKKIQLDKKTNKVTIQ